MRENYSVPTLFRGAGRYAGRNGKIPSFVPLSNWAGMKSVATLNEVFSNFSQRRRYEVWFVRIGLANGEGAWWFRYLLMNLGRGGCSAKPEGMPVQVWATWFPPGGNPQTFIQGFHLPALEFSVRGQSPFYFQAGKNGISENACRGALEVDGHRISWDLRYRSTFRVTLSDKGWIGFSRTPHSDALFSGQIKFDGRSFVGDPLGFGVQGHNCGFRHRNFWTWAHVYFLRSAGPPTTLEALVYEMPFGLVFRKAVLWHGGVKYIARKLKELRSDRQSLNWNFRCVVGNELQFQVTVDGHGPNVHRLSYQKTDCSGSFGIANNSLAAAKISIARRDGSVESLETTDGAVLEMTVSGGAST